MDANGSFLTGGGGGGVAQAPWGQRWSVGRVGLKGLCPTARECWSACVFAAKGASDVIPVSGSRLYLN
jgi:hypothetical protein